MMPWLKISSIPPLEQGTTAGEPYDSNMPLETRMRQNFKETHCLSKEQGTLLRSVELIGYFLLKLERFPVEFKCIRCAIPAPMRL